VILAIDGGLATFGYAIVVPGNGTVLACGVLIQKPRAKELGVLVDRKRRASNQADLLARILREYRIGTIAVEEMSFAPRSSANAKIGIGLSWGLVLGAAHARGAAHVVIPPKTWQRAIVPADLGEKDRDAIDYARVYAALAAYVDHRATGLDQIAKGQRNHALDAVGIGVYAALRLASSTQRSTTTTGATP
jgi:Holliday junction resolvasome RuvABC endonuclease subunit